MTRYSLALLSLVVLVTSLAAGCGGEAAGPGGSGASADRFDEQVESDIVRRIDLVAVQLDDLALQLESNPSIILDRGWRKNLTDAASDLSGIGRAVAEMDVPPARAEQHAALTRAVSCYTDSGLSMAVAVGVQAQNTTDIGVITPKALREIDRACRPLLDGATP